jgi:hypothetical protein
MVAEIRKCVQHNYGTAGHGPELWTLCCGSSTSHFLRYGVTKSFRTGGLERETQMVQLFATQDAVVISLFCEVSLVSFAAITLFVTSQRVIPKVSVYFVIDSVRKLLDTPSQKPNNYNVGISEYMCHINRRIRILCHVMLEGAISNYK